MINNATKFVLGLAVAGIVAAVAPSLLDDKVAWVIFVGVFLAGAAVAFGIGRSVGADLPPTGEGGAATPIDPADAPRASYAPFIAALGATVLVSGGAMGPRYVVAGLFIALVAAVLWLYDTMRKVVAPADATNVDLRFITPLALPVGAFALAITIAYSFSRVLLTVNETASWIIALVVAAVVLTIITAIAERVPATKVVAGIAGVGLLAVLVAGGAGADRGEREFESHRTEIPTVEVTAHNIAYDRDVIGLPADSNVEVSFTNLDVGTFHNVAIYTEDNAPVFAGKPIDHGTGLYKFKTPAAGTYRYVCDFHPGMTGELRLTQEGSSK
jgi:plastocyanin